jgi:nitroimidazol reductase NimA-like FMN-containing flavoprotein (pyridoxamine 5'-phosphate oxidase superfamily)
LPKYHMRKKEREIIDKNLLSEILRNGKYVVISMCRDNEPYLVTLSYGYDENKNALFFHCSPQGLKLDFIRQNPNVCATVIEDRGYKMGDCSHAYRSVVFWGKMYQLHDLAEKKHAIDVLLDHLEDNPDIIREKSLKSDEDYKDVGILRLDISEMTGKKSDQ